MKISQKTLFLIICGALCAVILSCATTGGATVSDGVGTSVLATGEWVTFNDLNDNGSSTATITEAQEVINGETVTVYNVKGNVTTKFQYGFAGWGLDQDEATLELYKTAKSFSFWILGDGKAYSIKLKTSNVSDHAYFEYRFSTEPGEPVFVEVPVAFFMQPSWGQPVRKNLTLVTGIEWQTHESWRRPGDVNPFEIKTWGFKVHN